MPTAARVVADLEERRDPPELAKVRKRLAPDEPALGMRMGALFDVAKTHTDLPLDEVHLLLDHPAYEPRMAAFCILDFKARRRLQPDQREELFRLYLERHDRITTWDMVDRSAPRVVGGYVSGRSPQPLFDLARANGPLQRRTAITAPLYFVRAGSDEDLAAGFAVAELLAGDPEAVVYNAVGIFLKHAGSRDPHSLYRFLDRHSATMPRPGLRLATEKLPPADRARYRG